MASKKTEKRKRQKAGKEKINKVGVRNKMVVDKNTRERIRTSQILNRLENFVLDEDDEVEMSPHKVSAALGLLKKTMPDLSAVHQTDANKEESHEEWVKRFNESAGEETSGD